MVVCGPGGDETAREGFKAPFGALHSKGKKSVRVFLLALTTILCKFTLVNIPAKNMTKVTVTIDTTKNTKLFLDMMHSLKFVKNVEPEKKADDKLSSDEIKLLESRWNDFLKNPKDVQTWKQVKAELVKKYAR